MWIYIIKSEVFTQWLVYLYLWRVVWPIVQIAIFDETNFLVVGWGSWFQENDVKFFENSFIQKSMFLKDN